jgi:hypothetical protein
MVKISDPGNGLNLAAQAAGFRFGEKPLPAFLAVSSAAT